MSQQTITKPDEQCQYNEPAIIPSKKQTTPSQPFGELSHAGASAINSRETDRERDRSRVRRLEPVPVVESSLNPCTVDRDEAIGRKLRFYISYKSTRLSRAHGRATVYLLMKEHDRLSVTGGRNMQLNCN